jgi:hypothetical protein
MFGIKRPAATAVALLALAVATPALANCPSVQKVNNNTVAQSTDISTAIVYGTTTNPGDTATYNISTPNDNPSGGIPGLIEYCIYPAQPPGNPSAAAALYNTPSDGPWLVDFSLVGRFGFKRPLGDPTNLPFDGSTQQVGTAVWPIGTCSGATNYAGCPGAPTAQTIVLHINDPDECSALYNQAGATTCFVLPTTTVTPPPSIVCNGNPACKEVDVDEALTDTPLTVPEFTKLHLHYAYVIVNQPTNNFNMVFLPPTPSTNDINNGGGKDYFGCEQIPDPSGAPGSAGVFSPYQTTPMSLDMFTATGTCTQYRFTITDGVANVKPAVPPPTPGSVVLQPGQQITFLVDMVTRCNKNAHKYEYTSTGLHLLNSGFTVKWFQSNDKLLHSFSTDPIGTLVNPIATGQIQTCS